MGSIDVQLDVQTVMLQENQRRGLGAALITDQRGGILESALAINERDPQTLRGNAEAGHLAITAVTQREMIIQEVAHEADHARAALGIVATAAACSLDHVRSVERIVEAPPASIGGVQGVTRV